jgi:hypothetical protein
MHASNSQKVVQRKIVSVHFLSVLAAALLLLMRASALAQEIDGDFEGETQYVDKDGNSRDIKEPTNKDRKKVADLFAVGKASNKEEEQTFEDVAHHYVYALTLKKNIANLGDKRKELKAKYLLPAGQKNRTVTDLHQRLNELTLATCRQVADDPKYPRAVRYNCVLMIGELDAEEYQPGSPNSIVPWPTATTALLEIARDEKQYLALRIGAVIGLKRHAQVGLAAPLQPQLAETLLGISEAPLDESNKDGEAWLRFVAADVLNEAIKRQIPVDPAKFATALVALIDNDSMPNWARAKVAGDLGKLPGPSLPAPQVPVAVRSLAGLTLTISQTSPFAVDQKAEAEKLKAQEAAKKAADKKNPDKAASDKGADKRGAEKKGESKDEQPQAAASAVVAEPPSATVQKLNSEEMMWQLSQIRLALYGKDAPTAREKGPDAALGLHVAADDPTKAMIDKIVSHIDEIVKSLTVVPDDKPETLDKLADTLRKANDDLEDLLTPPAEEAEAAEAPAPVAGRARPPAGSAPADISATGK